MGLHTSFYDNFEYLVWFLTLDSNWLSDNIHNFLIEGMKNWCAWLSLTKYDMDNEIRTFISSIYKNGKAKSFKITKRSQEGLLKWIELSLDNLKLKDNPNDICKKFLDLGFIEAYIEESKKRERTK